VATESLPSWARKLELSPHPEGGFFRETWRSTLTLDQPALPAEYAGPRSAGTAILFLLTPGQQSTWHAVRGAELWFFHRGSPLLLEIGSEQATATTYVMGAKVDSVQHLNCWFHADIGNEPDAGMMNRPWSAVWSYLASTSPTCDRTGTSLSSAHKYVRLGLDVVTGMTSHEGRRAVRPTIDALLAGTDSAQFDPATTWVPVTHPHRDGRVPARSLPGKAVLPPFGINNGHKLERAARRWRAELGVYLRLSLASQTISLHTDSKMPKEGIRHGTSRRQSSRYIWGGAWHGGLACAIACRGGCQSGNWRHP
jgi:predicted cupin superfamily sugar epimerase